MKKANKYLSIYIHIPFCVRKCLYCDFLSFAGMEHWKEQYVNALLREIKYYAPQYREYEIDTIYFGGGTPSFLGSDYISKIMEILKQNFEICQQAEITLEMNPGTVCTNDLEVYHRIGINRISIGVQSTNNQELKRLGRIYTYEDFCKVYRDARKVGFQNISLDLMLGLPGQKIEDLQNSVTQIVQLNPEHISVYSLIIEDGTVYADIFGENKEIQKWNELYPELCQLQLPDEEEERLQYEFACEKLAEYGYLQYEISNYAKLGYESKHNSGYWTGHEYVGFGLGAASLVDNARWKNETKLENYIAFLPEELQREKCNLSVQEQMEEFMFLGLRMTQGVSSVDFYERFQRNLLEVYEKWIAEMCKEKLLIYEDEHLLLSPKGMDLANYVMSGFLFD